MLALFETLHAGMPALFIVTQFKFQASVEHFYVTDLICFASATNFFHVFMSALSRGMVVVTNVLVHTM